MKRSNVVKKGKQFERECAELYTEITGVKYRRTPSSGSYRLDFPGDLIKTEKKESVLDNTILECKNHKTLAIPEWIEQVKGEMKDAGMSKFLLAFNLKGEKFFLINEALLRKFCTL